MVNAIYHAGHEYYKIMNYFANRAFVMLLMYATMNISTDRDPALVNAIVLIIVSLVIQ